MIELKPGRYCIGIWYIELPQLAGVGDHGGNMMAAAWRDEGSDEWHLQWRMRYYCGEGPEALFGKSNDKSSWYHTTRKNASEAQMYRDAAKFMRLSARAAAKFSGMKINVDFLEIRGDIDKLWTIAESGRAPHWLNMRRIEQKQDFTDPA